MDTRKNILQNEFDIDMESDGKELQGLMCNLGEGLYEDGIERGIEYGIERGELRKIMDLICRKLKKGKNVEQIAEELEEDPTVAECMVSVARRFAPEYELDKICGEVILPAEK